MCAIYPYQEYEANVPPSSSRDTYGLGQHSGKEICKNPIKKVSKSYLCAAVWNFAHINEIATEQTKGLLAFLAMLAGLASQHCKVL